jgi:leucine efflux protein
MFESVGVLNIWTFMIGLIMIIIAPGPNSLYVLKTGSSHGIKAGYSAAVGVFIGDAILILLAYLGVASLILASPMLFTIIRYLGAAYLLYLGVKILISMLGNQSIAKTQIKVKKENYFRKSLMLSLTNPKAILFYVSFFIQFIDYNYEHTWISYLVLASILEVLSFIYLTFLIILGTSLTQLFKDNKAISRIGNSVLGLFFMGFAARLASMS